MTYYLDENVFEDQILQMLYYDRIDISEGIDLAKCNNSKEFLICHSWFLIMDSNFKILYVMVVILSVTINDIAIITVKNDDYYCIIHSISKSEAVKSLKNFPLVNHGYT